jgi:hypothetical protein
VEIIADSYSSALMLAAHEDNTERVKMLLNKGVMLMREMLMERTASCRSPNSLGPVYRRGM